jgi:hypothetical protein
MCNSSCVPSHPASKWIPARVLYSLLNPLIVTLTLAGGEGQEAMIYLVMEACKSKLLGQRPAELQANAFSTCWQIELALLT